MATIWKDIMQIEPRQPQMHSNYLENVGNWDKIKLAVAIQSYSGKMHG